MVILYHILCALSLYRIKLQILGANVQITPSHFPLSQQYNARSMHVPNIQPMILFTAKRPVAAASAQA